MSKELVVKTKKDVIESLAMLVNKIRTIERRIAKVFDSDEDAIEMGISDNLETLILDLVGIPRDNTTSDEHGTHFNSHNYCKTCFCRDLWYGFIDDYIDENIDYEEFEKKCRMNLANYTLEQQKEG